MKDNTAAMETLQKATEADVEKKVGYSWRLEMPYKVASTVARTKLTIITVHPRTREQHEQNHDGDSK